MWAGSERQHMLPARQTDRSPGEPPKSAGGSAGSKRCCHSAGRQLEAERFPCLAVCLAGKVPPAPKSNPSKTLRGTRE